MTNDKPRLRIEIPTTRRGIDNREAYRKFVAEGDKKEEPQTPTTKPFEFRNPDVVAQDYVRIPQLGKIISRFEVQGYNNLRWENTHFKLHENGLYMPTIPEFMIHFCNVSDSYKSKGKKPLFDSAGNPLPQNEVEDIYLHLTKNHIAAYGNGTSEGTWTQLDAKFSTNNGVMKFSSEHRTKIDSQTGNKSLVPSKVENLESCVAEDSFVGLEINRQGLPIQKSKKQEYLQGQNIYFWYPRDKAVAWFYADSAGACLGCFRYPVDASSSLGVFAVLDGEARGQNGGAK